MQNSMYRCKIACARLISANEGDGFQGTLGVAVIQSITRDELWKICGRIDDRKSSDLDGIPNQALSAKVGAAA